MSTKTQFHRWYGCDEVTNLEVTDSVISRLGTHVQVGEGIVDPFDPEAIFRDDRPAIPGTYMLRSVSGWTDLRNGHKRFVVAAYFGRVAGYAESAPDLIEFDRSLGIEAE